MIIQSPEVINIESKGALRKRKIITKNIPKYLLSILSELKKRKIIEVTKILIVTPK
jgi:hypothetical protein